jgi:type I restriction enzyme S subunit
MTAAWRKVRIRDIAVTYDGPHATPKSPKTYTSGPVFLGISSLQGGRLDLSQSGFLSDEDFAAWTRRVAPRPGDVVFSYETRLGEAAIVPEGLRCALGRRLALMRPDKTEVDPRFLLYYYLGPAFQEVIRRNTVQGSTVDRIMLRDFPDFPIELPTLAEQRGIAATLGALDDKIELNRRLVSIIPQLIRVVVSQSLGAQPREVPVASLATFVNGGAYTKGASGSGRMVIRIAELNSGPGGSTVYSDIEVPDDKTARPGDILMSWSGSLGVYRWALDEAIVNQHIFKVLPTNDCPAWLVYDRLDEVMPMFQGIAKDKATTMGHIQRGHLESTLVAVPASDVVAALDHQLAPLWERLLLADREIVELSALRDTLLPELLSGRLRVPEAEGAVA